MAIITLCDGLEKCTERQDADLRIRAGERRAGPVWEGNEHAHRLGGSDCCAVGRSIRSTARLACRWRIVSAWRYPQLGPGLTVSSLIGRVRTPTTHVDKPVET